MPLSTTPSIIELEDEYGTGTARHTQERPVLGIWPEILNRLVSVHAQELPLFETIGTKPCD
jgi:hypothetical protein